MRKILEIKGEEVTYVVRGKLAFPSWDQKLWRSTSREAFARRGESRGPVWLASRVSAENNSSGPPRADGLGTLEG